MIACLAKSRRGKAVFEALAQLDPRYRYLGEPDPPRRALLRGLLVSARLDLPTAKRDARFSPPYLDWMSMDCARRIDSAGELVEAVVYWGATNMPLDPGRQKMPYFIVTDGPYDPDDPSYPPEWRPVRWAKSYLETQRRVFQGAAHVFTLSNWARDKVIKVHGLDQARVSRCGWGPLGNYGPPRVEPLAGKKVFLSVGSEWRRKGMDVLASAGVLLHSADPGVETIIAGSPVDLELAPAPGLSLMPYQVPSETVHKLMRDASCLVLAARFDASPHVLYEAMQYGTPVIATRTCGVPEAVPPRAGFLVDRPDPELIAQAMREFLASDERKLRAGAYATYEESGGWPAVAEVIHKVVRRML